MASGGTVRDDTSVATFNFTGGSITSLQAMQGGLY